MYAVIATGGKQYRIQEGELVNLEKLPHEVNDEVEFDNVLMVGGDQLQIGDPYLEGAKVKATVTKQGRGPKIKILKFKRRKHHMRRQGHRQNYTQVKINSIQTG